MGVIAFAAAIGLCAIRESADIPVDLSLVDVKQDWPNYFNHFYPIRVLLEFLFASLLVTALGEGSFSWNLVGANLLGFYLVHVFVRFDISKLVCILVEYDHGLVTQLVVLVALPFAFALVLGKTVF